MTVADRRRGVAGVGLVLGLLAFAYILSITSELFVLSEARRMLLWPYAGDLGRFFLFPELEWGHGRLTGIAAFQLTGGVCGVDSVCVNLTTALLISIAVVVLLVHTSQLTGTLGVSGAVGLLWLFSPAVLGIALWQSTRFDILAFIAALSTSAFWWWALGREHLGRGWQLAFTVASIVLLAISFNAKEVTYYLAGVLPLLAVIRGYPVGRIRRNLLLSAIPTLYAGWFIVYGLLNMAPDYAANSNNALIPRNLEALAREGLGVSPGFMGIHQVSPAFDALQAVARPGLWLVAVGAVAVAVVALVRTRWQRPALPALMAFGTEAYLLAIIGATMVANARSAGASGYYLSIPYWACLVLGALLLRRVASSRPAGRAAAVVLASVFVAASLLAYASHFTERSAWAVISSASDRMREIGATVRVLLGERPVSSVSWRTVGRPNGQQYLLRGNGLVTVGDEIWPFLVEDEGARPTVTALDEGDASYWRDRVASFDGSGEVLIVVSEDYRLRLLAHEGQALYDELG